MDRIKHFCLIALLPLIFFAPYFDGRVVPFGDDILVLNYPLLSLIARALRAGRLVLWNPYSGGGAPLVPFGALPFYPPTWALTLFSVPLAMSLIYALDLVIGGLGAYALAARVGVAPAARLVPAVAFPFSGFVLAHLYAGHFLEVGLICWFPAALAGVHWTAGDGVGTWRATLRRGLVAGGPVGMLVLANGVSWLVFVGYPLLLVALTLTLRTAWGARRGGVGGMARVGLRLVGGLAAAGVVAGLLGVVVLLPLRAVLGDTVRGAALSYVATTRISEPRLELAALVAPGLFGSDVTHTYWFPNPDAYFQEVYAYPGLAVLALALVGVVAGRRRRDVRLYAGLAVLGVVLALGANTPLYRALYDAAPGLDAARVPARWLLLAVLAASVLAGAGTDALLGATARHGSGRRPRPWLPLAALAALLTVGLLGGARARLLPGAARHATIAPALGHMIVVALAVALVALAVPHLPRSAGLTLLVALVTADLWTTNGQLVQPLTPAPYYRSAAVDTARAAAGTGRIWALGRAVPLREGMIDGRLFDVQDFAPLTPRDYWLVTHPGLTLARVDAGAARADLPRYNERLAALLGVSLALSPYPLRDRGLVPIGRARAPYWGLLNGDWSHPGPHPGPAYAYRVADGLPFALPVYTTRVARGRVPRAAVFAPSFDPLRVVLLDGGPAPAPLNGGVIANALAAWRRTLTPPPSGTATVVGPGVTRRGAAENGIVLRVTMRRVGTLLLDQVYDPGWTAIVDGRPASPRRADYVLTALPLSAGVHAVTLVYAPPSFALGAALSLLGYALLLAALLAGVPRVRRLDGVHRPFAPAVLTGTTGRPAGSRRSQGYGPLHSNPLTKH